MNRYLSKANKKSTECSSSHETNASNDIAQKFTVIYGTASKRKHKIYTNDGILETIGKRAKLVDSNGSTITSTTIKDAIEENSIIMIGCKDVQVGNKIIESNSSPSYSPTGSPPSPVDASEIIENSQKFTVLYGDASKRKHKIYKDDGTLEITGKQATLKDEKGKCIGSTLLKVEVDEDSLLVIGRKDVQVVSEITETHRTPEK